MCNVILFCRVSTKVQDYQRQVNDLTNAAEHHGWTVAHTFCEKISGATSNDKRNWRLAVMSAVASGPARLMPYPVSITPKRCGF